MVKLRPHHLLCMLTFVGKGYSPEFVANFEEIIKRVAEEKIVQIVDGPDDICAPLCMDAECHCFRASVTQRDVLALDALSNLMEEPVQSGMTLKLSVPMLERMRVAFVEGSTRAACEECSWQTLCTSIASEKFEGSKLLKALG
jgi:uncharacterized protein